MSKPGDAGNASARKTVISLDHIGKVYGTRELQYTALRNVSLVIKGGEVVAVLGPSGSGKTTLMNIIGTLDRPTAGKLFIDGIDSSTMSENSLCVLRNRKIGFIFQSYNLIPYLNVIENVTLPLMVDNIDTQENIERGRSMLREMGMGETLLKRPNELSGGQQQRVAIARALINNPPIVLADEPTGNLDSHTANLVLRLLMRIAKERGTTIIIVTHDINVARLTHREIHLKDGVIFKDKGN